MHTDIVLAVALGLVLALVNTLWGMRTARRAMRHAAPAFMKIFFVGMGIRMLVLLGAVVGALLLLPVHAPVFVGTLVGAYILGLVAEVIVLQYKGS